MSRSDFLSGTDTAALYAIVMRGRACTGWEIYETVRDTSATIFPSASIYKCLDRLAQRTFVSYKERAKRYSDSSVRAVRYYTILSAGKEVLVASRKLHAEMGAACADYLFAVSNLQ